MGKVCKHPKWLIDSQNIGTCANPECEERRQFPLSSRDQVVVLRPSKCNSQIEKGEEMKQADEGKEKPRKRPGPKKASKHGSIFERSMYYEKNKEAIIADLFAMGRNETRKRWNIPKGTLGALERRWLRGMSEKKRAKITAEGPQQQPETQKDGLPAFPEFSMTWDPTVQVKWLEMWPEIYERLHSRKQD